jgi:RimJ/RimL family protein N-acetyltransferase
MKDLSQIEELPVLNGDVVVLRPWRADDAADVAAMCDDDGTARWLPAMPHPYTLADGKEWVAGAARKWRDERWANFAVDDRATGVLIGSCTVTIGGGASPPPAWRC